MTEIQINRRKMLVLIKIKIGGQKKMVRISKTERKRRE